jgi:hypothetical protein
MGGGAWPFLVGGVICLVKKNWNLPEIGALYIFIQLLASSPNS